MILGLPLEYQSLVPSTCQVTSIPLSDKMANKSVSRSYLVLNFKATLKGKMSTFTLEVSATVI